MLNHVRKRFYRIAHLIVFIIGLGPTLNSVAASSYSIRIHRLQNHVSSGPLTPYSADINRPQPANCAAFMGPALWYIAKETLKALVKTTVADVIGSAGIVQLGTAMGGTSLAASQVPVIVPIITAGVGGIALTIKDKKTNRTLISINNPPSILQNCSDSLAGVREICNLSSGLSAVPASTTSISDIHITAPQSTPTIGAKTLPSLAGASDARSKFKVTVTTSSKPIGSSTTSSAGSSMIAPQSTPTISPGVTQTTLSQSQNTPTISFSSRSATGAPDSPSKFKVTVTTPSKPIGSSTTSSAGSSMIAPQSTPTISPGVTQTTLSQSQNTPTISFSSGSAAGAPDSPSPPRYTVITSRSRPDSNPTDSSPTGSSITTTSAQPIQGTVVIETPTTTTAPTYNKPSTLAHDISSSTPKSGPVNTITITDSSGTAQVTPRHNTPTITFSNEAPGFTARPDIKTIAPQSNSPTTSPTGSSITTTTAAQPIPVITVAETPITSSAPTYNPQPLSQSIPRNEGSLRPTAPTTQGVFKNVTSRNTNPLSPTETLNDRTLKLTDVPSKTTVKVGTRVSGSSTYLTNSELIQKEIERRAILSLENTQAWMRADPQNALNYAAAHNEYVKNLPSIIAKELAEVARNAPCEAARNHPHGSNIYSEKHGKYLKDLPQPEYEEATLTRPKDIQAKIDYEQTKHEMMKKKAARRAAQQAQATTPTTGAKPISNKSKASSGGEVASPMPSPELPPEKDTGEQQSQQQAKPTQNQPQQSQNQSANNTAQSTERLPTTEVSGIGEKIEEVTSSVSEMVRDAGKELFKFTGTAANHMKEISRMIPIQTLKDIIKAPMYVLKDPQGATNALMYYSKMWKNGKLYNVEVLYDAATNEIMHFKYQSEALGPLLKVK